MKLSAPLALAFLATGVCAGPVVQRDIKSVSASFDKIQDGLDIFISAMKTFNGDVDDILGGISKVTRTSEQAAEMMQSSSKLRLAEAIQLLPRLESLRDRGDIIASEMLSKRAIIEGSQKCGQVRAQLDRIVSVAENFFDAYMSKIPAVAKDITKVKTEEVSQTVARVVGYVAPGQCNDVQTSSA